MQPLHIRARRPVREAVNMFEKRVCNMIPATRAGLSLTQDALASWVDMHERKVS
jgi:hypothetical protein